MRILYGVQATGNGHITRARAMSTALAAQGMEVDYLFSGRPPEQLFDMEIFGEYRCARGMTFSWRDGRIDLPRTLFKNNPLQTVREIRGIDLDRYDLVITDFEPVTAWAAKIGNRPSLGIGHQYAFMSKKVPSSGRTFSGNLIIRRFAPGQRTLGFHWRHFDSAILPPLIEPSPYPLSIKPGMVLVYLPFEEKRRVVEFLRGGSNAQFHLYCDVERQQEMGNIRLHPFCRHAFQRDLARCEGVIANAGFGLLSESIQAGKKLLVKPMKGQMEQLSNAAALELLGLGRVMREYDHQQLVQWLMDESPEPRPYPNVAAAIVDWIKSGFSIDENQLARQLWGAG